MFDRVLNTTLYLRLSYYFDFRFCYFFKYWPLYIFCLELQLHWFSFIYGKKFSRNLNRITILEIHYTDIKVFKSWKKVAKILLFYKYFDLQIKSNMTIQLKQHQYIKKQTKVENRLPKVIEVAPEPASWTTTVALLILALTIVLRNTPIWSTYCMIIQWYK